MLAIAGIPILVASVSQAPLNIKLRCTSWQQLANIHRRDLSRHAIFLKASQLPPLGTAVRIDLTLPTESMIVLAGVVAEHVPEGELGGRGPGIDIKLNTIPESALWLIETALASAAKQSGAIPVMAEATVGAAHVRLHAVIDMRAQPALPSTFLRASGVTLTQTAGGTPSVVSSQCGTIIYWREE